MIRVRCVGSAYPEDPAMDHDAWIARHHVVALAPMLVGGGKPATRVYLSDNAGWFATREPADSLAKRLQDDSP